MTVNLKTENGEKMLVMLHKYNAHSVWKRLQRIIVLLLIVALIMDRPTV